MQKITTQIITHNNEKTIQKCLESIQPLDSTIFVLDDNSTDNTLEIASSYTSNIIKIKKNRDTERNEIVKKSETNLQFYIEPWEYLASGHDKILSINDKIPHRLFVIQNDILTKPIRVWDKSSNISFINPVFELINSEKSKIINVILNSQEHDDEEYNLNKLQKWQKEEPQTSNHYYYESMIHLSKLRYDEFIKKSEYFLFNCKALNTAAIMTRYYLAWTYCIIKKKPNEALQNLLVCLSARPLMAEFWCLLGDIYYFLQYDFHRAVRFYENAVHFGSKRKSGDEWPIQLSKYKKYPQEMIENCRDLSSKLMKNNLVASSVDVHATKLNVNNNDFKVFDK